MLARTARSALASRSALQLGRAVAPLGALRRLSSLPPHQILGMPALSPTMTAGNLVEWYKSEGNKIEAGDEVAVVETDKAKMDYMSEDEYYLAKILVQGGTDDIPVGTPIAVVVDDEEHIAAFKDFTPPADGATPAPAAPPPPAASAGTAAAAAAPTPAAAPPTPAVAPVPAGAQPPASPYAKAIAAQRGISLAGVAGTGPGGRIIAADVLEAAQAPPKVAEAATAAADATGASVPPPRPDVPFVDIPNSNIRKVTAKRMVENKNTAPHYYLTMEIEMDALMAMRAQVNAAQDTKTSVNDYVIRACALALQDVPVCNSQWNDEYIRQFTAADISVAVNTPIGLLTPIVFSAESKSVVQISSDVKSLAAKAKDGKLKPDEFIGGTFTVSNLGMTGVKQFTAIINGPQACILAVGGAEKKVVPNEGPDAATNPFTTKSVMLVSLSSDHRVVDGAIGAEWLKAFKQKMENPVLLLL